MTLLAFEAVTRRHRVGRELRPVLDDVSFELWPGDFVAIRGPRRAGKTTLLRVAAGVETPDAGVIRLAGQDVTHTSANERTRRLRAIGYAPKEWRAASGKPLLDHVAVPLLADGLPLHTAMAKAHAAIERVGASEHAMTPAHELSAANLARAVLARALAREPRVLLVDEPAATAEPEARETLLALLRSLMAQDDGLALMLTTSDIAGLGGASRVLTIHDGHLRSFDEPAQVIPLTSGGQLDRVGPLT